MGYRSCSSSVFMIGVHKRSKFLRALWRVRTSWFVSVVDEDLVVFHHGE